ncbi:GspH/FimT family pseudopilin [uncultured Umboniibacter sp.]|uniref:GspH/FimT family pseudopilin n=1 Tax=uncultured Umboniibacter sp. TaxID=1798917 RepID=UPI0026087C69|nr:GspH/FimT family pseudopilin [uncultured Umboniibacter sp.]
MTSYRGFTLVELLIILVIIGIVASIALPNFQSWAAQSQQRTVALQLQSGISIARQEAVKRRANVWIKPNGSASSDWGKGFFVATSDSTSYADCSAATAAASCLFVSEAFSNVTITASVTEVVYGRDGRSDVASDASATNDSFKICSTSASGLNSSHVALKLSGGVELSTGDSCT